MLQEIRTIVISIFFSLFVSTGSGLTQVTISQIVNELDQQLSKVNSDSEKYEIVYNTVNNFLAQAWVATNEGQYSVSKNNYLHAFELAENLDYEKKYWSFVLDSIHIKRRYSLVANLHFNYGLLLGAAEIKNERLLEYKRTIEIATRFGDFYNLALAYCGLVYVHLERQNTDSARFYATKALEIPPDKYNYQDYTYVAYINGMIHNLYQQSDTALVLFRKGLVQALPSHFQELAVHYLGMSIAFRQLNQKDSSYYYGQKATSLFEKFSELQMLNLNLGSAYESLAKHFEYFPQADSLTKYLKLEKDTKVFFLNKKIKELVDLQRVLLDEQVEAKDKERFLLQKNHQIKTLSLLSVLGVILGIVILLLINNRQKQKAYAMLKSTQSQLIQSEKMASLGELTAGIAHEIQNPLNFVNNFSDVNTELAVELEQAIVKGNYADAKAIAKDIKDNEEKINHHGKRADGIVKGMLQHSRSNTGQKEPTDLNALCDEYVRLAYHGLRAKEKSFNAKFEADFDSSLPKVNVVPQDIGRVFLNLINNAFYAVNERSKKGETGYEPKVTITTSYSPHTPTSQHANMLITIHDNGPGIPDAIKDKIFQPFFTTKPTGQGTGLGLSLAYDIVKAHGGEIKVLTKEKEGTDFIIQLPNV